MAEATKAHGAKPHTHAEKPAEKALEKAPVANGNGKGEKEKEKASKPKLQTVFASADEAQKEAGNRTKGPRRAFTCTKGDKEIHVVANNEGRALGLAALNDGWVAQELGKEAKKPKAIGMDAILAAINAMPEAERAAVQAQLKALTGGK